MSLSCSSLNVIQVKIESNKKKIKKKKDYRIGARQRGLDKQSDTTIIEAREEIKRINMVIMYSLYSNNNRQRVQV